MTVRQLIERLQLHDGGLEVEVRCVWEGDQPYSNLFLPRIVLQEVDADIAKDHVILECDQYDDGEG